MLSKPLSSIVSQPIIGADILVSGVTLDSRVVTSGNLFCAIKGECQDGHKYIDAAVRNGAVAVAVESEAYTKIDHISYVVSPALKEELGEIAARFYNDPTRKMFVAGITGTNGKTSISSYIAQLLYMLNQECGEIGTLGVRYRDNTIATKNTTPDAITLQQCFYQMSQEGITNAVMEVSSHSMVQHRCKGIHFATAVYSNISHDHLDYHGTFENYFAAKMQLFSLPELPLAIINLDDAYSSRVIASINKHTKLLTYSLKNSAADIYLSDIQYLKDKYQALLHYKNTVVEIETCLVGEFNLYNLLAAFAVVCERGFDIYTLAALCAKVLPVSGRMESVTNTLGISAIVDYAHTPDALENVLLNLKKNIRGKVITVFGCGGDRDKSKRPLMAAIAEKYSDYVVITADNPRSESLDNIIQQIESGMTEGSKQYVVCSDRKQAITIAVNMASASDCILIAGKGHEKTQTIGKNIMPFDDIKVLAEALQNKKVLPC